MKSIIISLVAVFIAAALGYCAASWEVFALIMTAMIVLWYSYETAGLKEETRKSNLIETKPAITGEVQKRDDGEWGLFIKNIGKGAATEITLGSDSDSHEFQLKKNCLGSSEESEIGVKFEGESMNNFAQTFNRPVLLTVEFKRMISKENKYSTRIKIEGTDIAEIITDWND